MKIKPLNVDEMRSHGEQLLLDHYQELTLHKEIVKLKVDWEKYRQFHAIGCLLALGAWECNEHTGQDELIGYSVFIIQTHAHYKDLKMASNDVLFLKKDKRKGSKGIRLIKESERAVKEAGAVKIGWHCKYDTYLGKILEKLGYLPEEFVMTKLL